MLLERLFNTRNSQLLEYVLDAVDLGKLDADGLGHSTTLGNALVGEKIDRVQATPLLNRRALHFII